MNLKMWLLRPITCFEMPKPINLAFILVTILLNSASAAVPMSELFPYLESQGAFGFQVSNESNYLANFSTSFKYLNTTYKQIRIRNSGHLILEGKFLV